MEIEKHVKRIIKEIEEFYDLYYAFNVDDIIRKYKLPLEEDAGGTLEEMKDILIEVFHNTEWNMTNLPKDYILNKVLKAIKETDFEEDDCLIIDTYPFCLYEEDTSLSIEFNYDLEKFQLEILRIS